ncbi:MAG: DUF2793 domain-containing protein [Hyphomonadaceae bacterium]|jgi:hypothetical protein|nr:DUF2793 domain-containing protein [Hyphomonadaceae bacterium]
MDTTSNLTLPFIMAAQAQKHVTHNETLRVLDAVVQLMVLDKDLNAPPSTPVEGACYIVAASPTGAWSGQAGKVAAYQDGAWAFHAPREGWLAWAADEGVLYVRAGSAWVRFSAAGALGNIVEDATPQLGGDLDANGRNIGFDDGTGITDDAGNAQVTFRKTAGAVNRIGVTNAAAGNAPRIAAEGADANIDLTLAGKGSGHPKATLFGINATADPTTRFAVAAPASLFDHAGNGHQHKINKNAAGDTASILFQTGYSGRAEMGTAGDDNFRFKVSADGSSWTEAIIIDRATGAVALPATPRREILTANRTYYVRTDGSDANNGLTNAGGGAFLTIQKAIDVVGQLDLSVYDITIAVGAGTFTGANVLKPLVGAGTAGISGAGATTIISTTSATCITGTGVRNWHLSNMRLTAATAGHAIQALASSHIKFSGIEFGAVAGGSSHVVATQGSLVEATGSYTVTGGASAHMLALWGGQIAVAGKTVTLMGTPAFGTAFALGSRIGRIEANGNTYSGAATGARYGSDLNAVIFTNGGGANYFPGNAAGSTATGGQYN